MKAAQLPEDVSLIAIECAVKYQAIRAKKQVRCRCSVALAPP